MEHKENIPMYRTTWGHSKQKLAARRIV